MDDGVEAFRTEREVEGAGGGETRAVLDALAGRAVERGAQAGEWEVGAGDGAARGARQKDARMAAAAADIKEPLAASQPQPARQLRRLGDGGVSVATDVAANGSALDDAVGC